jgi:hypothetical protein
VREEIESQWITIKEKKKAFVGHIMATKMVNLNVIEFHFIRRVQW